MTIDYTRPPTQHTPPPIPGPPAQPQQKSGCMKWGAIGCGLFALICAIIVVGIVVFVFSLFKSTYVYKDAVRRAQENPQVVAALGTPIGTGFLVSGSVKTDNDSGTANLNIPLQGPKGKGTLQLSATMKNNEWRYDRLVVNPEHGATIDLLAAESPGGQNP